MNKYIYLFLALLTSSITACNTTTPIVSICDFCPEEIIHPDSTLLFITTTDLSEDFGLLSTQNDEAIIIIYDFKDTSNLNKPLFLTQHEFTKTATHKAFSFDKTLLKKNTNYLFVLLEEDSDHTTEEIEYRFRNHFTGLYTAYKNLQFDVIQKVLLDDDILGIQPFTLNSKFTIEGIQLGDKFRYTVFIDN